MRGNDFAVKLVVIDRFDASGNDCLPERLNDVKQKRKAFGVKPEPAQSAKRARAKDTDHTNRDRSAFWSEEIPPVNKI